MGERLDIAEGAFRGCFGCGDANDTGLALVFEREDEQVVARTELSGDYAGYPAFAHGGVVAAMLDEAMGWAMFHVAGVHGVTRSLNVTYRRPVSLARPLVLRGRVVKIEGKQLELEATLEDERGRLLARGVGDWVTVREGRAVELAPKPHR